VPMAGVGVCAARSARQDPDVSGVALQRPPVGLRLRMTIHLSSITVERHLRVWRLRLDLDGTGAGDKAGDLLGFNGNVHQPDDELRVTMLLSGWGVCPAPGGWRDEDGTWVVPVVRLE
jgi:hypothetical protein